MKVAASTWARYEPPSLSVSTTAQTHLEVRVGFRVLLILPIVQEQATLPRFGHAHIVLPALRIWEVVAICAAGGTGGPPCYDANCSMCTDPNRALISIVLVTGKRPVAKETSMVTIGSIRPARAGGRRDDAGCSAHELHLSLLPEPVPPLIRNASLASIMRASSFAERRGPCSRGSGPHVDQRGQVFTRSSRDLRLPADLT